MPEMVPQAKDPEEFRREAVELFLQSDRSRAEVAKSLGDQQRAARGAGKSRAARRGARGRSTRPSAPRSQSKRPWEWLLPRRRTPRVAAAIELA